MKRTSVFLTVAALLFCFASGANAQMKDTGLFVGGGLSYAWENFSDELEDSFANIDVDDAWGANLFFGYRFVKYLSVEANFNWYDSFKIETNLGDTELDVWTLMADFKGMFPLVGNRFVPYVRLGGGYMYAEIENSDESDFAWNIGGGMDYFITQNVSLGIDGKYVIGTGDLEDLEFFVGSILIGFHF